MTTGDGSWMFLPLAIFCNANLFTSENPRDDLHLGKWQNTGLACKKNPRKILGGNSVFSGFQFFRLWNYTQGLSCENYILGSLNSVFHVGGLKTLCKGMWLFIDWFLYMGKLEALLVWTWTEWTNLAPSCAALIYTAGGSDVDIRSV